MSKGQHPLRDRLETWGDILSHPWRWIVATPFAVLATFQSIRDEFLPEPLAQKWKLPNWLPHWDWKTWALLALAILFLGVLEGAYRVIRAKRDPEWRDLVADALQKGEDLSQEQLANVQALPDWEKRTFDWANETVAMLAANCGKPDRQLFASNAAFEKKFVTGSVNRAHSDGRQALETRMEVLREILRRPIAAGGS